MAAPKKQPTPTQAPSSLPPLLDLNLIHRDLLREVISSARVRAAMNSASAPRPILGSSKGGAFVWGRDVVVAYWDSIARDGWPADALEAV